MRLTFKIYIAVIHPYYSVSLKFIYFGYCVMFYGMNIPQFIYVLPVHRHLNFSRLLFCSVLINILLHLIIQFQDFFRVYAREWNSWVVDYIQNRINSLWYPQNQSPPYLLISVINISITNSSDTPVLLCSLYPIDCRAWKVLAFYDITYLSCSRLLFKAH